MRRVKLNRHRVKEAAARKGVTMTVLARHYLDCTSPTLYNYLRQGFPLDKAEQLVNTLGFSIQELQAGLRGL